LFFFAWKRMLRNIGKTQKKRGSVKGTWPSSKTKKERGCRRNATPNSQGSEKGANCRLRIWIWGITFSSWGKKDEAGLKGKNPTTKICREPHGTPGGPRRKKQKVFGAKKTPPPQLMKRKKGKRESGKEIRKRILGFHLSWEKMGYNILVLKKGMARLEPKDYLSRISTPHEVQEGGKTQKKGD